MIASDFISVLQKIYPNGGWTVRAESEESYVVEWGGCQELTSQQAHEELQIIKAQRERDAHNAPILAALEANDRRAIRAMRDNDEDYILQLRAEAEALRAQLQ